MTIAVCAPYCRGEAALAAIRLADLILARGESVRLVSTRPAAAGVDPQWDGRVRSSRSEHWAEDCAAFVWFDAPRRLVGRARSVSPDAVQFCVVPWHGTSLRDLARLAKFDALITPCRAAHRTLAAAGRKLRRRIHHVRFDSGLVPCRRVGLLVPGQVSACVLVPRGPAGRPWAALIPALLADRAHLRISVVCRRPPCHLQELRRVYGPRLAWAQPGDVMRLDRLCYEHDWVVFGQDHAEFGLLADRAARCGAGVIVPDLPPFSEVITPELGLLAPCTLATSGLGAPAALLTAYWGVCQAALALPALALDRLHQSRYDHEGASRQFTAFWAERLRL